MSRAGDTVSRDDGGDQVVVCKVNPRDVVSVPTDSNFGKLRVCRYEVVSVLKTIYAAPVTGQPMAKRAVTPEVVRKIAAEHREMGKFKLD